MSQPSAYRPTTDNGTTPQHTSINRVQLGRTIRRLREAAGLSQREVANRLNLSSIAHIETGRQAVGLDKLAILADTLGTTVSTLLTEDGDRLPADTALIAKLAGQQREITSILATTAGLVQRLAEQAARTEQLLAVALGYRED